MGKLILIEKSQAKDAAAIRAGLLHDGYPVLVAGSAAEALRLTRRGGPDLVFLDLRRAGPAALRSARLLRRAAVARRILVVALGPGTGRRGAAAGLLSAVVLGTIRGLLAAPACPSFAPAPLPGNERAPSPPLSPA